MKKCIKCGEMKELSLFFKNKRRKDGLFPYCKECCKVYFKKRYIKKIPKERKLTKKQYDVLKMIDNIYKNFGKFPTYKELAEAFSVSKQGIDKCLSGVVKKLK